MTSFVLKTCVCFMPLNCCALLNSPVLHRHGVDVVQRGVAVEDLERLADLDAEDVRAVRGSPSDRARRASPAPGTQVAEAVLHVDEHVLQRRAGADDDRPRS